MTQANKTTTQTTGEQIAAEFCLSLAEQRRLAKMIDARTAGDAGPVEEERWNRGEYRMHWLIRGDKVLYVWPDGTTTPSGCSPDEIRNDPKFYRCDRDNNNTKEERWNYCDGKWHWLIQNDKVLCVLADGSIESSKLSPDQIRNSGRFFRCDANGKRLTPQKPVEEERWGYCDGKGPWHWLIQNDKVLCVLADGTMQPSGYSPDQVRNDPKFFRCDANGKRLVPEKPAPTMQQSKPSDKTEPERVPGWTMDNPYVKKFLFNRPWASVAMSIFGELAWDAAIEASVEWLNHEGREREARTMQLALMSTKQSNQQRGASDVTE